MTNKQITVVVFFIMIFSLFTLSAGWAATYYIDYATGSDTNNGTATLTPWKHCPGDPNATGNANITLSAGTIVVFKGGVTYSFNASINDNIEANASGTSGNLITYRSGHKHSPQWGTSRAVIDCADANVDFDAGRTGCLDLNNYSYIKVEGFEMKNQPVNQYNTGFIAWHGATGSNVTIDDNYLHETNGDALTIQGSASGVRPDNFTITNNTIQNSFGHLIEVRYAFDTVLIEGNTLDKAGNNPYRASTPAGNAIAINWYQSRYGSLNYTIRGNDINDTSTSPNKSLILMMQTVTNMLIEKNYFHGVTGYSGIDLVGNYNNLTIRNNIFHVFPSTTRGSLSFYTDMGNSYGFVDGLKIHNNTFVATPAYDGIIYFHKGNNTTLGAHFTNVDIINNIFDFTDGDYTYAYMLYIGADSGGSNPVVQLSTFTCDYNVYYGGSKTNSFFFTSSGAVNFATWKSLTGKDAYSTNATVSFIDRAGNNFHLASNDTAAKDRGVDLSVKGFSNDKDNAQRLFNSNWDIGAYEYNTIRLKAPVITDIQ